MAKKTNDETDTNEAASPGTPEDAVATAATPPADLGGDADATDPELEAERAKRLAAGEDRRPGVATEKLRGKVAELKGEVTVRNNARSTRGLCNRREPAEGKAPSSFHIRKIDIQPGQSASVPAGFLQTDGAIEMLASGEIEILADD